MRSVRRRARGVVLMDNLSKFGVQDLQQRGTRSPPNTSVRRRTYLGCLTVDFLKPRSSARRGTDGRRRPRSGGTGAGGSTSPRSKRLRPRDRTGAGSRARSGREVPLSPVVDGVRASPPGTLPVDALPDPSFRGEAGTSDVECLVSSVIPRSSRFLFSGPRDRPRSQRGSGSGRVGRERSWHDSTVLVVDDDDDIVVEGVMSADVAGPSFRRRFRRNSSDGRLPRSRRGSCPRRASPDVVDLDVTLDSGTAPSPAREDWRSRPGVPDPRPSSLRRGSGPPPPRVPRRPVTTGHRHGLGSYVVSTDGRIQSPLRRQAQRQIEADERLARLLQERELGQRRAAVPHGRHVLDLLDSSSDDDESWPEDDGNDSSSDEPVLLLPGYSHGGSRLPPRLPAPSRRRGSAALAPLFPIVSLLETLHAPFISHLEFFDSDNGEDDDYEHLVQLGEALGEVAPRGLTGDQINLLPTRRVVGLDLVSEKRTCHICLEDFKRNNLVRTLPCLHEFHKGCLDKWLRRNSTCPLCRKQAVE